jgi:hypothetical protein
MMTENMFIIISEKNKQITKKNICIIQTKLTVLQLQYQVFGIFQLLVFHFFFLDLMLMNYVEELLVHLMMMNEFVQQMFEVIKYVVVDQLVIVLVLLMVYYLHH